MECPAETSRGPLIGSKMLTNSGRVLGLVLALAGGESACGDSSGDTDDSSSQSTTNSNVTSNQSSSSNSETATNSGSSASSGSDSSSSSDSTSTTLPRPALDVERYTLRANFDPAIKRLVGEVTIDLRVLDAGAQEVVLDSLVEVVGVKLADQSELTFTTQASDGSVSIHLPTPTASVNTLVSLTIRYLATPDVGTDGLVVLEGTAQDGGFPVIYTNSEPSSARKWMPSHDVPSDRAWFSLEINAPAQDKVVASGDLGTDTVLADGRHVVTYASSMPLPTYEMAFAQGAFVVEKAQVGKVPLELWHRPGLITDGATTLKNLGEGLEVIESLAGPYPFTQYRLVLIPGFPGGMENASSTFQGEVYSVAHDLGSDLELSMHELGHQWFGDAITVTVADDIWFKEGMATLLEFCVTRSLQEKESNPDYCASDLYVEDGVPIIDPTKVGLAKYTSGPYSRAAWLLSQIRRQVGDAAFWQGWRDLLSQHHAGNVTTKDVVDAWAASPGYDPAAVQRALTALAVPTIVGMQTSESVTLTLRDPDAAMIVPFELTWFESGAQQQVVALASEVPLTLKRGGTVDAPDLLGVDVEDVHPNL